MVFELFVTPLGDKTNAWGIRQMFRIERFTIALKECCIQKYFQEAFFVSALNRSLKGRKNNFLTKLESPK